LPAVVNTTRNQAAVRQEAAATITIIVIVDPVRRRPHEAEPSRARQVGTSALTVSRGVPRLIGQQGCIGTVPYRRTDNGSTDGSPAPEITAALGTSLAQLLSMPSQIQHRHHQTYAHSIELI
jgi:hypothetical protein